MDGELKVSVITPSYNQGRFIEDCILSVMNQTYKNIEHIIIDNESNDETDIIVKKYLCKYNLKYIREKDAGQANAINKGFKMATGDIICWLNSDDLFFNHYCIELVINKFRENPRFDVITGNGYYCDKNLKFIKSIIPYAEGINKDVIKYFDNILQPSTFWKKNSLLLDEKLKYVFDWAFFIELFQRGFNFLYLNEYLSIYRTYGENKTGLDNRDRKYEIYLIQRKYLGLRNLNTYLCYFMYLCYLISEKTKLKIIKQFVTKLILILCKITFRLIQL